MSTNYMSFVEPAVAQQLQRGHAIALCIDGSIEVTWPGGTALCDVLCTAAGPVIVEVGDAVLVLIPAREGERGVVVGRIGLAASTAKPSATSEATSDETPSELVLEAKECLTLRVGEGSITIRADGKILIKGKDLVSHAQRMNRIRGGAVAIN